jgi:hypothetical protein
MAAHESHFEKTAADSPIQVEPNWQVQMDSPMFNSLLENAQQRQGPGAIVGRTADQVKDNVEQGVKTAVRETQATARAARERGEIAGTLVLNFDAIDQSNRAHRRDGKITRDEILDFRKEHSTTLTSNELRNLQIASRDFQTQIGRGKDWANKADVETYKTAPPVIVRRPQPRHENEGIDDKVKDKVKGIWKGIRKRVGD